MAYLQHAPRAVENAAFLPPTPPHLHNTPTRDPLREVFLKTVKTPTFSGETSAKGFMQAFEAACEALQVPPSGRKPIFITAMKGNAQSWLYGLPSLANMSFAELKAELLADYAGEPVTYKREL